MSRWTLFFLISALLTSPAPVAAQDSYETPVDEAAPAEPVSSEIVMEEVFGMSGMPVLQVGMVQAGRVATKIGLAPGDLIVAVNGRYLREFAEFSGFARYLRRVVHEDETTIDLYRYDPRAGSYYPVLIETYDMPGNDDPAWDALGIDTAFGYVVVEVWEDGPGARMGVLPGDFLQEIDGIKVPQLSGPYDLDDLVAETGDDPGRDVELRVGRWIPYGHSRAIGQFRILRGRL